MKTTLYKKIAYVLIICVLFGVFLTAFAACDSTENRQTNVTVLTWNVYQGSADVQACLSTLATEQPDIVCLQEATPNAYARIVDPFAVAHANYAVACSTVDDQVCRTPILYDTDKLSVLFQHTEVFVDSDHGSPSKSVAICVFADKLGNKFIVANIHGAVTRNKYQGLEDMTAEELAELAIVWRTSNYRQAVAAINNVCTTYGALPVAVCGDFNTTASSAPFTVWTDNGYVDGQHNALSGGDDGLRTTHIVGEMSPTGEAIDHIVANDKVIFDSYRVLRDNVTLAASDHCPIFCELRMQQDNVSEK